MSGYKLEIKETLKVHFTTNKPLRNCHPSQRVSTHPVEISTLGRAASGGALAPEPQRATRSTPELIRTVPQKPFFSHFLSWATGSWNLGWDGSTRICEKKAGLSRLNADVWKICRVEPDQPRLQKKRLLEPAQLELLENLSSCESLKNYRENHEMRENLTFS